MLLIRTFVILSNILITADSSSKTPSRALIERLMSITDGNFFFCSSINFPYLVCLRCMLFLRLVSCPIHLIPRYTKYCLSSKLLDQDGKVRHLLSKD